MLKLMSTLVLSLSLLSCQTWRDMYAEYSNKYLLPVGAKLELLVPLTYPGQHARIFLQQQLQGGNTGSIGFSMGYRFSGSGVNEYEPYCELEVNVLSDGSFQLVPGEFEIYKVEQRVYPWNIVGAPLQVAQNEDTGLSQITYATDYWLRSEANPDVRSMSCRHVQDQEPGRYVTLEEMRVALAGVFRLP